MISKNLLLFFCHGSLFYEKKKLKSYYQNYTTAITGWFGSPKPLQLSTSIISQDHIFLPGFFLLRQFQLASTVLEHISSLALVQENSTLTIKNNTMARTMCTFNIKVLLQVSDGTEQCAQKILTVAYHWKY